MNYPVRGFVLKPFDEKAELGDIYSSVSFVAGTITNYLLEKEIPHNLIVSDIGQTVYIIPRQHQDKQEKTAFKCAWLEIAGLALCKSEDAYEKVTKEAYEDVLENQVSLKQADFDAIKDSVLQVFKQTYE